MSQPVPPPLPSMPAPPALPDVVRSSPIDDAPDAVVLGLKEVPGSTRTKGRITMEELDNPRRPKIVHVTGRIKALMNGEISIEDLDDEELARGQVRDKNGRFSGSRSAMVPRKFHDEMVRRLLARGDEIYREHYLKALEVFTEIAVDPSNKAADRLKAADMIVTRIAGKVPDRVELQATIKPWESMLQGVVQPGEDFDVDVAREEVHDAEVVGDEVSDATEDEVEVQYVEDDYYADDEPEETPSF